MADDTTASKTNGFTAGETTIIMCLIKHLKGDLPSDFDAVAKELGYKDASIVKTRWGQIKRKKINGASASGDTPAKATPKKRKTAATAGDDADDAETPAKAKRGRKSKKKDESEEEAVVVKKEEVEDGEDAVETTEAAEGADDQMLPLLKKGGDAEGPKLHGCRPA